MLFQASRVRLLRVSYPSTVPKCVPRILVARMATVPNVSRFAMFVRCFISSILQLGLKDPDLYKTHGFINGEWCSGSGSFGVFSTRYSCKLYMSRSSYDLLLDPANGNKLGQVAEMTVDDTKKAIAAADEALHSWSRTTAKVCQPRTLTP